MVQCLAHTLQLNVRPQHSYIQLTAVTLLEGVNTVRDNKRAFLSCLHFAFGLNFYHPREPGWYCCHLLNLCLFCFNKAIWALSKRLFNVLWPCLYTCLWTEIANVLAVQVLVLKLFKCVHGMKMKVMFPLIFMHLVRKHLHSCINFL